MKRHILFYTMSLLFLFSSVFAQSPDPVPDPAPPASTVPPAPSAKPPTPSPPAEASRERLVALDFDNVDIPVLVKFVGELTMKNFVIDEQVRGKITLFSPVKIPVSKAYDVFLAVLDMKGYKVVPAGPVYQILPIASAPPPRSLHVYTVKDGDVEEISKILLGIVSRVEPPRPNMQIPGDKPTESITGRVDIVTDKTTNSLIITASDQDYPIVEKMIKDFDIPRKQVYVEALVMEMSAEMFRELGTDLGALFGYIRGDAMTIGGFNTEPPQLIAAAVAAVAGSSGSSSSTSGPSASIPTDVRAFNIRTFLKALQSEPRVNVLSTPQLLASDRQKAEIVVGQLVPFPGGTTQNQVGTTVTIDRKDVGITLRLTPTIMASNKVKLEVFQEISSIAETAARSGTSAQALGPTTNKRSATTNVMVKDGQTAVIGGLMRDNLTTSKTGIPLLQNIPILGYFFKTETKRIEKTNLLLFITPYIVPDDADQSGLDAIRKKKVQGSIDFMNENKIKSNPVQRETLEQMAPPPSP